MTDVHAGVQQGRSSRLDHVLSSLLSTAPELEGAAVVSFDGLPMAAALPAAMDEDRVAAMSAALLSLGDRAAQGLGRGDLSQVYVEGEHGTVFLVSADEEAVLVAVAARHAKVGLMLFEVRRAAQAVAAALLADDADAGIDPYARLTEVVESVAPAAPAQPEPAYAEQTYSEPEYTPPTEAQRAYADGLEQAAREQYAAAQQIEEAARAAVEASAPHAGGPVMVPTGAADSGVAPDGLAWPQFPPVDRQGWS